MSKVIRRYAPPEMIPYVKTYESVTAGLSDKDVGNKIRAILNYEVIEKTKSFTILRVSHIHVIESRRKY